MPGRSRAAGLPGVSASSWLGPMLARVRLHDIEPRDEPGRPPAVAKRRRWYAAALIGPGNAYLRWLGAGVAVLPDRRWKARERAVHRLAFGVDCEEDAGGWLILPRWPGRVLADLGADVSLPASDRLRAVATAAGALRGLHRVAIPGLDGRPDRLSHGDATLRNVLHDAESGRASWFDFDTEHVPAMPEASRLADDLRALLYSALATLADLPPAVVFDAVRSSYDAPGPWAVLRSRLARGPVHAGPFHLAQANPTADRRREVERLIRSA